MHEETNASLSAHCKMQILRNSPDFMNPKIPSSMVAKSCTSKEKIIPMKDCKRTGSLYRNMVTLSDPRDCNFFPSKFNKLEFTYKNLDFMDR